ncbi:MAG: Wzt carbohydrate-binding domain-containing protein, partial [Endomicrobiales bacterium]
LAVGDMKFQNKCLGKMGEVSRSGRTVLFVSHNMTAVAQLCRRVLWLDKGCLVKSGSPTDIIPQYLQSQVTRATLEGLAEKHKCWPEAVDMKGGAASPGVIRIGDPLEIAVRIRCRAAMSTQIGIEIRDVLGDNLFWLYPHNEYLDLHPGNPTVVTVKVDRLNLYPGRYYVGIWLGQGGRIEEYYWDREVVSFEVNHNPEVNYFFNFNPQSTKVFQEFTYSIAKEE